tara:strand:+ start:2996 stop:3187 length:192 start_codon:yes stop_codon:yes gene_type:complete
MGSLNVPGESAPYTDVKDYTGASAEPFDKQIEANKKKRDRFIQGELFKKVEAKRKSTQRVNEA